MSVVQARMLVCCCKESLRCSVNGEQAMYSNVGKRRGVLERSGVHILSILNDLTFACAKLDLAFAIPAQCKRCASAGLQRASVVMRCTGKGRQVGVLQGEQLKIKCVEHNAELLT